MSTKQASELGNAGPICRLQIPRLVLAAVLVIPLGVLLAPDNSISSAYLRLQDLPVLMALIATMLGLTLRVPRVRLPDLPFRWRHITTFAALLVIALWWGSYALMENYAVTRDEHMVLFDMAIFAKGRLVEPLAVEWRPFIQALVPDFLLKVPGSAVIASAYLPGNAMMRTAFSRIADPALLNPLLTGASVLALFEIACRLFPNDRRSVLVTLVLYVGSVQVLVTAMTDYAMTGHTALNLIWLALFLRDRPWTHALAMVVSLWAIGLHQPVFHPLFAGPFLLWSLGQRRYLLFSIYAVALLAALAFWMLYASLALRGAGVFVSGGAGDAAYFWRDRILPLLLDRDPGTLLATVLNLIRYVTWQNLALIPLLFAAWPLVRRNVGPALPLAAGIGVTLLFCVVILPFQGHGWGYRYFCGVLGSAALLGGLGYDRWASRDRSVADGAFVSLSLVTVVAMVFLLVRAHQFVAPYARLDEFVASAKTDMVLIDTERPSMAIDQVRNSPDLSNRPIRLSSRDIDAAGLRELCRRGTISLVTRIDMHRRGFGFNVADHNPRFEHLTQVLERGGCLAL